MKYLSYLLALIVLYPISVLPFRVLYFLSDLTSLFLRFILRYRNSTINKNLRNSFPDKSDRDLLIIRNKYYRHLTDTVFETIKCLTIRKSEIARRCEIKDLHILNEYNDNSRSVVAVLGHYGNWEWAALSSALSVRQQMVVIYKPLSNPYFDRLLNRTRARFGVKMISMAEVPRFYAENKNEVFVNCFVSDQSPSSIKGVYWLEFLNQKTAVQSGPGKLASKYDHAVIFVHLEKVKRGYYHLRMKKLVEDPKNLSAVEITGIHVAELEDRIREKPEFWLWSHKRWKRKFKPEASITQ